MLNTLDVIHFNLHKLSKDIAEMRRLGRKPITVYSRCDIVNNDGAQQSNVSHTRVNLHNLAPAHPLWNRYKALKRQVSLWLMVVHFCKNPGETHKYGTVTERATFARKLANHGKPEMYDRALIMYDELVSKLDREKTYHGFDKYLADRAALMAERSETKVELEAVMA